MSNVSERELQAREYAKNYPHVVVDTPMMGPFSVGNVTSYNDRVIINLCLRTDRSHPKNATISFPKDWAKASQFKPGDQVNVQIEKGLVKRIWQAKPESVKTIRSDVSTPIVNGEVERVLEEIEAEASVEELIRESEELVPIEVDDLPY